MRLKQTIKNKIRHLTLQTKLIMIFLFTTMIVFVTNLYVYSNINQMLINIDNIYESNAELSELQNALSDVQISMAEYLSTKSSDSMEQYFWSEQEYYRLIRQLNDGIVDDEVLLMEKNIRSMSEQYLSLTNTTIEAKRSRNISKYKASYEQAEELYTYIDTYIYSLNNKQFQNNTSNYKILLTTLTYAEALNMLILLIVGGLNVFLIVMLVRNITRPLKALAFAANEVAEGNLDIHFIRPGSQDEVAVVTKAFQKMVTSLKDYIAQLRESMEKESALKEKELLMEAHLKDAQLKYLQAQINPHFLFNTLNAGAQLAMMEESDKTYQYIQNVADFFRYNIKNSHTVVTLGEEIRMVDQYIYILNVRYSGEIDYRKETDGSLDDIKLPSMVLQPIVENSIKYGIHDLNREGFIRLTALREGECCVISIYDNGAGIEPEMIDKIMNSRLETSDLGEGSGGIGLDNVITRLRLFFEDQQVIQMTSEGHNKGTRTTIRIPIKQEV